MSLQSAWLSENNKWLQSSPRQLCEPDPALPAGQIPASAAHSSPSLQHPMWKSSEAVPPKQAIYQHPQQEITLVDAYINATQNASLSSINVNTVRVTMTVTARRVRVRVRVRARARMRERDCDVHNDALTSLPQMPH